MHGPLPRSMAAVLLGVGLLPTMGATAVAEALAPDSMTLAMLTTERLS